MTKSWRVPSTGKFQFLLVFTGAVAVAWLSFAFYSMGRYGGSLDELLMETFAFSPFIGMVLLASGYWIFKKDVPRQVTIDTEKDEITFWVNKKKSVVMPLSAISFALHTHRLYSVLVFCKESPASRPGYWVHKECFDIVAPMMTFSWNPALLKEIADGLAKAGVRQLDRKNTKMFVVRILG